MTTIPIYRVIVANGYAEFKTLEEAQDFLTQNNGLSIEEDTTEIPDSAQEAT